MIPELGCTDNPGFVANATIKTILIQVIADATVVAIAGVVFVRTPEIQLVKSAGIGCSQVSLFCLPSVLTTSSRNW